MIWEVLQALSYFPLDLALIGALAFLAFYHHEDEGEGVRPFDWERD